MRPIVLLAALAVSARAPPARAQVSNTGIAVESGAWAPLGAGGGLAPTFALSASRWIEGDVDAYARLAFGSADETAGRGAAPALAGTAGLRLSLGRAPLRPQGFLEAGWARVPAPGEARWPWP